MRASAVAPSDHRALYDPFVDRICTMGRASGIERAEVEALMGSPLHYSVRSDLLSERHQLLTGRVVILKGFVADVRLLADGRRQFMRLRVPGELVDPDQTVSLARDTLTTLSDVILASLSEPEDDRGAIAAVLKRNDALAHLELLNQITRLGRQSALERTGHFLLELHDRLKLAGFARHWSFDLPLTQETMADVLGLTSVHMNRTLQQLRKDGLLELERHVVFLRDPGALARLCDYARGCYASD